MAIRKVAFTLPLIMSALIGCTPNQAPVAKQPIFSPTMPHDAAWNATQSPDGRVWLAWYDAQRRLHTLAPEGKDETPFHITTPNRASSGIDLAWAADQAWVAFRDKEPQRDVFLAPFSHPERLTGLGAETVPLARVKLAARNDRLAALWYGEQPDAKTGKTYHLFYREVDKEAKPLGEKAEQVLEGIYPTMDITPSGRVTVVSWVPQEGKHFIKARTKNADAPFSSPVQVASIAPITPVMGAFHSGERTIAYWHAQYGQNLDEFRFEIAWSDDGMTWNTTRIPDLDNLDIESAAHASDDQGNVAIAVSVIKPHADKSDKLNTLLFVSHDHGATWSPAIPLRNDPEKALIYSKARAPQVAFIGPGKVFVAWEDWRDFRPAVRFSYSEDAGKTWKVHDQSLTADPSRNAQLNIFSKSLFSQPDKVTLIYERYIGDDFQTKELFKILMSAEQLSAYKAAEEKQPDPDRLKMRAQEYWQALENKDWAKAYSMLDPFYRSRVSFESYKEDKGRINFIKPEIKLAETHRSLGLVVAHTTVKVEPFFKNGQKFEFPQQERDIPTRWIWIDGDWYMEFYSEGKDIRYTRY